MGEEGKDEESSEGKGGMTGRIEAGGELGRVDKIKVRIINI